MACLLIHGLRNQNLPRYQVFYPRYASGKASKKGILQTSQLFGFNAVSWPLRRRLHLLVQQKTSLNQGRMIKVSRIYYHLFVFRFSSVSLITHKNYSQLVLVLQRAENTLEWKKIVKVKILMLSKWAGENKRGKVFRKFAELHFVFV